MLELTPADVDLLTSARTATLATVAPDGQPRLVPVCFTLHDDGRLWIALDEKPKQGPDPRSLARVRDVLARPGVSVLVERWSEDWSALAWLRLHGRATLVEPASVAPGVVSALRARYPQYVEHDLEGRPMLAIELERAVRWSAAASGSR
jgi:coenzyme F420-0:L-glutamate ligase/coenzyme F420-1:gamma-L-glutamate ligase